MGKEEELIEKLKGMTDKEVIDYYSSTMMKKYSRLNFAYVRVHILFDFIEVIRKNASQLQSPANRVTVQSGKMEAGNQLYEYMIVEICSFYDIIKEAIKQGVKNLPQLPTYEPTLRDFRNQITAHLDKKGKLLTTKDWMDKYQEVEKIGTQKIISDFEEYYKNCVNLFGNDI